MRITYRIPKIICSGQTFFKLCDATKSFLHSLPIGGLFGNQAIELAGIIPRPDRQAKGIGTSLVKEFIDEYSPEALIAYTRNPALLRVLGNVGLVSDVIEYESPEQTALLIPHATVGEDGILYHIGRYAPPGLYGADDPADRTYRGVILKQHCKELEDKNSALAVRVELGGNK